MTTSPSPPLESALPAPVLSVRAVLIATAAGAVLLVWLMAALATLSVQRASEHLGDARNSYEQLAIINRLEAEFGRLLLAEMETLASPNATPELGRPTAEAIEPLFKRLLVLIDEEFERHGTSRDDRVREIRNAEAMRTLFAQLHMRLEQPSMASSRQDAAAAVQAFFEQTVRGDTARIDRLVRSVSADEAEEVEQTLADMQRLRQRLEWGTPLAGLLAALGAVLSMALIHALIMSPVRDLRVGVRRFTDGDLGHRINVVRPLELADLARQCNAMARRLAEQQAHLTRVNEALEDTVRQRTRQLEESSERLRAIDASRRLFFGKISHELRTPVTVLSGEAEVALRSRDESVDGYRSALEHILATSGYLRRRLNDLIGLARSEDGRVQIERERMSLRDGLREAATVAEAYARSSSVFLETDAGSEPAWIIGDASWIRQATLALIDNAVKFSPADGRVSARIEHGPQGHAIEIADQGPGISAEMLPKIFDPYYQTVDGRERGGAGLGLAVARWVSEQHGGRISARNAYDGGLVVRMEFPFEEAR
ncbi:MAG: ATP-binding protein [Nevskia sp.]|uniref:ATP-binding protein n=1 Tax=Nevskia sp. TaxID=1929292 RepID=UPI004036E7BB